MMEATRPDPVDTQQFVVGESRSQRVETLGAPITTLKENDESCDLYRLYTRGAARRIVVHV
jgi:hypothetical protein